MASIAQLVAGDYAAQNDPLNALPRFSDVAKGTQGSTTRNPFAAGISSGIDQLQGMGGAFVAALGDIVGSKGIKDWGVEVANRNSQEAAANGRSDLSTPLWEQNLSDVPAWLAYRASQQVPQMAVQLGGGAVLGRAAKGLGMVLPEAAAEAGARAPKLFGGGGTAIGPISREGMEQGGELARNLVGASVAGYPMAVGSMYGEAIDRGDPNRSDALMAAGLGVPYAALDAMEPVGLMSRLKKGSEGKMAARVLSGAMSGMALEAPQEAVQTAMEQLFRPDLSAGEKFKNVLDAAVTGAAVGGLFGGASGFRRTKNPNELTNEEATATVDSALGKTSTGQQAPELQLTGEPAEAQRPFAKEPVEKVQKMLAEVEGRMASQPFEQRSQQDLVHRQRLQSELEARSQEQADKTNPLKDVDGPELQRAVQQWDALAQQAEAAKQANDQAELARVQKLMTPEIEGVANAARTELARRTEDRTMVIPGFENLPNQPTPAIAFEQQQKREIADAQVAAEREQKQIETSAEVANHISELAGYKSVPQSIAKLNFKSKDEAYGYVKDRLNQGNAPKSIMTAGKAIGFLDEDGNDQTPNQIEQKIAANKEKLTGLYQKYQASGRAKSFETAIAKVQEQNKLLSNQLEMVRTGEEAATLRERERNPPSEMQPGPAKLRGTDGKYTTVTVLEKKPVEVQGKLYQPVRTEKGAEVNVPIASLWSVAPSSAPVKAAEAQSPATQQAEARKPLPINPRETDATIPPLKQPLFKDTPAAKRGGFVQPRAEVEQAPGSTEYTAGSEARTFEGIDRAAPGYWQGENVDNRPLEDQLPTQEERDAIYRDQKRYDPLFTDIIADKTLPRSVRQKASRARDALRYSPDDHTEIVNEALAAYSAHTGDMQFKKTQGDGGTFTPERMANVSETTNESQFGRTEAVPSEFGAHTYNYYDKGTGRIYNNAQTAETQAQMQRELGRMQFASAMQSIENHRADEAQKLANNPQGPFANAEMGVSTSESVPAPLANMLRDFMGSLGMGDIRVFLYDRNDLNSLAAKDKYALHGPYSAPLAGSALEAEGGVGAFGKPGDFHIMLTREGGDLDSVETLVHEVGHIIKQLALNTATDTEWAALQSNYISWKAEKMRGTVGQLRASLRATAGRARSDTTDTRKVSELPENDRNYYLSFDEYFADNTAKWALTSQKPRSIIERFFARLGAKLRALAALVLNKDPAVVNDKPDPAIAAFLDRMQENPALTKLRVARYKMNPQKMESIRQMIANPRPQPNVQTMHWRLGKIAEAGNNALKQIMNLPAWSDVSDKLNRLGLYVTTLHHITERFGGLFQPGTLKAYGEVLRLQRAQSNRLSHLMAHGHQMWEALDAVNSKAADDTRKLMSYTVSDINPKKTWAEQKHLHSLSNAKLLEQRANEANELYRNLNRIVFKDGALAGKRASDVYDALEASNQMMRYGEHAVNLYNAIQAEAAVDAEFKKSIKDPMEGFLAADPQVYEDPLLARAYWKKARDDMKQAAMDYIKDTRGRLGSVSERDQNKFDKNTNKITTMINTIAEQDAKMEQTPYFHAPRFGEYFASFRVKADDKGVLDERMLADMAKTMEKEGFDLTIPIETRLDHMFFRFETQDDVNRFQKLMKTWEQKGYITRAPRPGEKTGQEPKIGKRDQMSFIEEPQYITQLIDYLRKEMDESTYLDDLSPEEVQRRQAFLKQTESNIRQFYNNRLPDNSLTKINLARYSVPGFSKDMMRGYAFRADLGAQALAGISTSPKLTDALSSLTQQVNSMKVLGNAEPKKLFTAQNTVFELMKRESNRAIVNRNSYYDMLRAANHNYFLGLSPSYAATQMVSLAVTLWPKLAAKHGYVASAQAIKDVTPGAIRIVKAAMAQGFKNTFAQGFDATITSKVLEDAKVPVSDRDFILRLANNGLFDMGSQSRELGRVIEGKKDSKFETAMRVASSFGYYSEMMTRLASALAAKKLYEASLKPGEQVNRAALEKYAEEVVTDSMFEFSNFNTARAFGKQGIAGQATPIGFSFMSYPYQLMEILSREIHKAFMDSSLTPKQKSEARRYLIAHLVAVGGVAGSLGLPGAALMGAVVNNLADLFSDDDEPFDVNVAYRNWLAATFGEGVGEVLARGLPRAIGFDISSRVGEADLLPFTRLLADRRQFDDAFADWRANMLGSPFSMLSNVGSGAQQIANGDVIEGSKQMVPYALKGLVGAWSMSDKGYTDKKGNKLPMEPDALDVFYQMMGLTPAGKAEYDEQNRAYQASRGEMTRIATKYRKDLANAYESGDYETVADLTDKVSQFDLEHPEYAVLPTIGSVLSKRARERYGAVDTQAPLGIKPELANEYSFGNVR